jgi:hypothetical protein
VAVPKYPLGIAVNVPELKLGHIERHVVMANFVKGPDNAAY